LLRRKRLLHLPAQKGDKERDRWGDLEKGRIEGNEILKRQGWESGVLQGLKE
jgi:hypothetical protein